MSIKNNNLVFFITCALILLVGNLTLFTVYVTDVCEQLQFEYKIEPILKNKFNVSDKK